MSLLRGCIKAEHPRASSMLRGDMMCCSMTSQNVFDRFGRITGEAFGPSRNFLGKSAMLQIPITQQLACFFFQFSGQPTYCSPYLLPVHDANSCLNTVYKWRQSKLILLAKSIALRHLTSISQDLRMSAPAFRVLLCLRTNSARKSSIPLARKLRCLQIRVDYAARLGNYLCSYLREAFGFHSYAASVE